MSGGFSSKRNMAIGRGALVPLNRLNRKYQTAIPVAEKYQEKKESMSWFKEKLRDWLFPNENETIGGGYVERDELDVDSSTAIDFRVIPAAGGNIIRVSSYDRRTDIDRVSLHIVTPDEDMATELAQILSIERLSK